MGDTTESHSRRIAERDRREGLIWFIWFVLFIWLVSFSQTDQINKRNQPVLALYASQPVVPEKFSASC